MPFLLSDNFISQLTRLRVDYESATGVKLNKTSQPLAISCFFGAKDVESRHRQIAFIEQWFALLQKDLCEGRSHDSLERMQCHVASLRVLVVVGLYINSKIEETYTLRSGASAVLEQLINKALGISSDNVMDHETKACCLLAAKRYLAKPGRLQAINEGVRDPITETQWREFSRFITSQYALLEKKYQREYPITAVTVPVCGKSLALAGYATGYVLGDMIAKTSELTPVRCAMTAIMGSCVVTIGGPISAVSTMLIAGRILDIFCGISLAYVMGTSMEYVGKGVGVGVGLPLDIACKLLQTTRGLLEQAYRGDVKLSGLSLINGHQVIKGDEISCEELMGRPEQFLDGYEDELVDVQVDDIGFEVTINGQRAKFSWQEFELARQEEEPIRLCIL